MTRGKFLTFEGIDGAGKTTQIDALEHWLEGRGIEVVRTREPGGPALSEQIRRMILHEEMTPLTETLLFFAARAEHIALTIEPALARGAWVLSDRFTDATYAYQVGAKGVDGRKVETLERLVQGSLQPDHTVLFDLSPAIAAERVSRARVADRFESENLAFFRRVREAYLFRAQLAPERFFLLDASLDPQTITGQLLAEAAKWL